MLFNSVLFLAFFALTYLIYWQLRGKSRSLFLIFASALFYATWGLEREGWIGLRWLFHFIGILYINYGLVRWMMRKPASRRIVLLIAIVLNVGNLALFKYAGFFLQVISDLSIPAWDITAGIFLPLAISFYTFQILAFTVDVYRGQVTESIDFRKYSLFILFFPQLIAGPIMRSSDFLPQLDAPSLSRRRMYDGIWLILGGLVKKVLLADPAGALLGPVYHSPGLYEGWTILLAGMIFSLQVYCDFSGYTDIARGCAYLLGYDIPENFRAPFFSRTGKELWARWHITLATWLRDYIYFPLGGNRLGQVRTYFNLFITFTLGGFWHGADYTYICWGAMWGVLLALERLLEEKFSFALHKIKNPLIQGLQILFTFVLFSIGALMFRAQSVDYGTHSVSSANVMLSLIGGLFTHTSDVIRSGFAGSSFEYRQLTEVFGPDILAAAPLPQGDSTFVLFAAVAFFHWLQYKPGRLESWRKHDTLLLLVSGTLLFGLLLPTLVQGGHQFIYFVF
ncbi:MAG: MBOAT family protein [Spirochaetales bacterium]|nr:MBOAT family protein [Spirochaetales bacterium]